MDNGSIVETLANLVSGATGGAKGLSDEALSLFGSQIEKVVEKMGLVNGEDFEALKKAYDDVHARLTQLEEAKK